jgi:hypothetical protein
VQNSHLLELIQTSVHFQENYHVQESGDSWMAVVSCMELALNEIPHHNNFKSVDTIPNIVDIMEKTSSRALDDLQSS